MTALAAGVFHRLFFFSVLICKRPCSRICEAGACRKHLNCKADQC